MVDSMSLREALVTDLPRLQEIEREAGEVFRQVGMNAVADDEPLSVDVLRGYVDRGRAWVIAAPADVPGPNERLGPALNRYVRYDPTLPAWSCLRRQ